MRKVIVVGGGTSGMMAAIQAAKMGSEVTLLEKNPVLGRKLLLTGGGRCNVTNSAQGEELIKHIPGNGKFLYSSLSQFDQSDIISFFNEVGVELKEEDHGRIFPVTDQAKTILNALINQLKEENVNVLTKCEVKELLVKDNKITGVKLKSNETMLADAVILATGGCTYPGTGSTGVGYKFAQSVGHTVTKLYPTEVALKSNDSFIKSHELQGLALEDIELSVLGESDNKKPLTSHRLDMIFTHFGYSGPAVLRCSGEVVKYLSETNSSECVLSLNTIPDISFTDFTQYAELNRDRLLANVLKNWLPERMGQVVIKEANLSNELHYKNLSPKEIEKLYKSLTDFKLTVYEPLPMAQATVTAGGVELTEVEPASMQSKIVEGLYFSGELLDINAYTGGYNMTVAFVTGAVAGWHAAWGS